MSPDRAPAGGLPVPVAVLGTGIHLPPRVVGNRELTESLDTTAEWIVSRTGIRERRWLEPELATSDMCVPAAEAALAAAGRSALDVDAIIVSTYTYDQPLPSTALIVKDRLGAAGALPLDLTQAACVGGLQAVLLAAHLLQNPATGTVLVVAADCASRVTDPADRTTRIFFGDAAAAVVLGRATDGGLLAHHHGSQLSYDVEIAAGGSRLPVSAETLAAGRHYVHMDGRAVWKSATVNLPDSITTAAARAGLTPSQIDHYFLHQANLNILTEALATLGVPPERAPITLDRLGNTGGAGMLTALHEVAGAGRLRPGQAYAMAAIGAGFQWGTLIFRHPGR
ncbi:3-oxoacyl-[acyl-carrier-protein] synthase 3 [Actinorhabdospora filicis]|uniref:3-oxoacyl-[acyl-carrier-protein] synthase 3 n=1 Tax=Actinorhabdospora filicis TaxID=1785913 RepID=A0A9W6SM24_9ACTN|nr:ketoacyl-ACP synthase III [Actinorhabdospora filicis]GLZ78478.1 3-oxoacyl-[acyl-carrier-protein] synthase 3 [Actinorhabdospora filicis]